MKFKLIAGVVLATLSISAATATSANTYPRPKSGQCNIYPTVYKVDGQHRLVASFKVQCDTSKVMEVLVEGRFDMRDPSDPDSEPSEKWGIHREYPAAWSRTVTFRRKCATTPRNKALKNYEWSGQYNIVITGFNGQRAVGEGGEYNPQTIKCYMKGRTYSPPPAE